MKRKSATKKSAARPSGAKPSTVKNAKPTAKSRPKATPKPTTKPAAKTSAKAMTKPVPIKAAAKKAAPVRAPKVAPTPAAKHAPAVPSPASRRVIFIDVENTSSETTLLRVLDHLQVDRKVQPTEVIAIGNWKSVGTKVARTLASLGAQLVHSAPAPGVRDWSDLWIAVSAGRWLAGAAPGDQLDLVSDDRAFDAVHDAAASVGVICRRISYRHIPGAAAASPAPAAAESERSHRPRRRGGRGRSRGSAPALHPPRIHAAAAPVAATAAAEPGPAPTAAEHAEAHAASQAQIRTILSRLTRGDSTRWINLDLLANALKAEGFSRPPGSPRLITRVRNIKGVELNPNGMVRLAGEESSRPADVAPAAATDTLATADAPAAGDAGVDDLTALPARRPRRRGGRRHRRRPTGDAADSTAMPDNGEAAEDTAEPSDQS
jgi:hypothetical protein